MIRVELRASTSKEHFGISNLCIEIDLGFQLFPNLIDSIFVYCAYISYYDYLLRHKHAKWEKRQTDKNKSKIAAKMDLWKKSSLLILLCRTDITRDCMTNATSISRRWTGNRRAPSRQRWYGILIWILTSISTAFESSESLLYWLLCIRFLQDWNPSRIEDSNHPSRASTHVCARL